MPELPEVEIVKQGLQKKVSGLKVKKTKVLNKNLRFLVPYNLNKEIIDKTIKCVIRRGKHGIIMLNGNFHLHFHLGMTGHF